MASTLYVCMRMTDLLCEVSLCMHLQDSDPPDV